MRSREAVGLYPVLEMSQAELDELFRSSPAGQMPTGRGEGLAIVAPGTAVSKVAARLVRRLVWKGKVFDQRGESLRNRLLPFDLEAIVARVYRGPSQLDGNECIVLDYSRTSLVARWVRDEIREISPGRYLGLAYLAKRRLLHFVLVFPVAPASEAA
jgi:hypothetical protein